MNKLMILATVAVAAVAAQSATIKWQTGTIKLPGEGGAQTGATMSSSNVNRYYFALTGAIAGDVFANYATWNSTESKYDFDSTGSAAGTLSKGNATFTDPASYSSGDTSYAAVILWNDANSDGKMNAGDYYLAKQDSYTLAADSGKTIALSMNEMTWTAIAAPGPGPDPSPEPTSGVLMLLGMAGLALRRKRA